MPRQIFWANGEEMTRYWRKLHSEELRNLYFSRHSVRMVKSRVFRWRGGGMWHVLRERRHAYRVLVGKPEGKRSLGRPRCKWEGNIRIDLKVMG